MRIHAAHIMHAKWNHFKMFNIYNIIYAYIYTYVYTNIQTYIPWNTKRKVVNLFFSFFFFFLAAINHIFKNYIISLIQECVQATPGYRFGTSHIYSIYMHHMRTLYTHIHIYRYILQCLRVFLKNASNHQRMRSAHTRAFYVATNICIIV